MTEISADRPSSNPQGDLLGDFLDAFAGLFDERIEPVNMF